MKRQTILKWAREHNAKPFWYVAAALNSQSKYWTVKTRIVESTANKLKQYCINKGWLSK